MKLLYKPVSMLASVVSGLFATILFKQVWRATTGAEQAPSARDPEYNWRQIAVAALVQGAIFGAVKAVVDRAGASAFAHATGSWPA